jgi:hypothetical protein
MPKYFFHLIGDLPARDLLGHECEHDDAAKRDGRILAHRIGTEKPEMVREENAILVTDEDEEELFKIPLASVNA